MMSIHCNTHNINITHNACCTCHTIRYSAIHTRYILYIHHLLNDGSKSYSESSGLPREMLLVAAYGRSSRHRFEMAARARIAAADYSKWLLEPTLSRSVLEKSLAAVRDRNNAVRSLLALARASQIALPCLLVLRCPPLFGACHVRSRTGTYINVNEKPTLTFQSSI